MATHMPTLNTMHLIAVPVTFSMAKCLIGRKYGVRKCSAPRGGLRMLAAAATVTATLALAGCATPQAPVAKAVYDFGPMRPSNAKAVSTTASPVASSVPSPVALALAEVDASTALDGLSVVYRLAYADAQQLRPYALARWSMPPAQLVRTRLRDALAARGPVLGPADGATPWLLKVELDEFSQQFDAPASSSGAVRLHASLFNANKLVAQRTVQATAPAASQDAAGGVRAITAATDDAVAQLAAWVAEQMR
jgi:cholesterol transport system auxiliary component